MREIVSSLGEQEARDFEGIIANDRCAYYLTKLTAGVPVLLKKETGVQVFEELQRRVAIDIEQDVARKYTKAMLEKEQEHALKIAEISAEFTEQRDQSDKALETEKAARKDIAGRLEILEQTVNLISARSEDANTTLITLCREYRRHVEFIWSLGFAVAMGFLGFVVGQLATLGALPLWASALIGVFCGAAGFHIVPSYLFGEFTEKRGDSAFVSKARKLQIESLAQEIMEQARIEATRRSR